MSETHHPPQPATPDEKGEAGVERSVLFFEQVNHSWRTTHCCTEVKADGVLSEGVERWK